MSTNPSNKPQHDFSVQEHTETKTRKPWLKRTFGKMEDGGLRGNIFLMTISTVGGTFFFLPSYAKDCGLIMIIILVALPAFVSYYASQKLYYGFKYTNAKTYDECMKSILGPGLGYMSNVTIFLHTFSSVVGLWTFTYKIMVNILQTIFGYEDIKSNTAFKYCYFTTIMLCLFLSSLSGNIEKLKVVSMFGIGIIIYMLIVFTVQTADYYNAYKNYEGQEFEIISFNIGPRLLEAYGMCMFLYLNQYSIIPICNNIKQITIKRINKVLSRTIVFVFFMFLILIVVGYFSLPNVDVLSADTVKFDRLFLLRNSIEGQTDYFIQIGKCFFILYLTIGMLVRGHFFLIYFQQLIANTVHFFKGDKIELLKADDVEEVTPEERKIRDTKINDAVDAHVADGNNPVEIYLQPIEEGCQDEESVHESVVVDKKPEKNVKKHMINFIFLTFTMLLTVLVSENLATFLSIAGGFVSIFELIVFPLIMILALDSKEKILGKVEKPVMITVASILIAVGLFSASITLKNKIIG